MADANTEHLIQTKVEGVLAATPYAASSLKRLTGGTGNFIYHAIPNNPQPGCAEGVVIKQGEGYVATRPEFPLTTSRCVIEQEALVYLEGLAPATTSASAISTPKLYFFYPQTFTQVQEYLPNAVNLKEYALEHFKAPTSGSVKPHCLSLGHSLGAWLRSFHDWSQESGQLGFRKIVEKNKEMQMIKLMINYQMLLGMVDQYPSILGDVKDVLQEVHGAAASELQDESSLQPIHGDFWTGNVLLPNVPLQDDQRTPIKIIDWELTQLGVRPLDLGQMIAELWQLKLYKDIDAGEWFIKGFAEGYGTVDDVFAFRTIIHVGVHLICFGSQTPGWGSKEQGENLVKVGKEVILKAWQKDREGFQDHILGCLFE